MPNSKSDADLVGNEQLSNLDHLDNGETLSTLGGGSVSMASEATDKSSLVDDDDDSVDTGPCNFSFNNFNILYMYWSSNDDVCGRMELRKITILYNNHANYNWLWCYCLLLKTITMSCSFIA